MERLDTCSQMSGLFVAHCTLVQNVQWANRSGTPQQHLEPRAVKAKLSRILLVQSSLVSIM